MADSVDLIMVASGVTITAKLAESKGFDASTVVGGVVLIAGIMVLDEFNDRLATLFSWLILFAVLGNHGETLLKALSAVTGKGAAATTTPGGNPVAGGASGGSGLPTGSSTFGL